MSNIDLSRYNKFGYPFIKYNDGSEILLLLTDFSYNENTSMSNFHYFSNSGVRSHDSYGTNSYSFDITGDLSKTGTELVNILKYLIKPGNISDTLSFSVSGYMNSDKLIEFTKLQLTNLTLNVGTDKVLTYSITLEGSMNRGTDAVQFNTNNATPTTYWKADEIVNLPISVGGFSISNFLNITDMSLSFNTNQSEIAYTSKAKLVNPNDIVSDATLTINYEIASGDGDNVLALKDFTDRSDVPVALGSADETIQIGNIKFTYADGLTIGTLSGITEGSSGGQINTFSMSITLKLDLIQSIEAQQ